MSLIKVGTMYINPEHIVSIRLRGTGSEVNLADGNYVLFGQDPDVVHARIFGDAT